MRHKPQVYFALYRARGVEQGALRPIHDSLWRSLVTAADRATALADQRMAALIGAAQKVEHYEIASYTPLMTLASKLGYDAAAGKK